MKKVDLLKLVESFGDEDSVLETLQGIEGLAKSSELDVTKLTLEDYKNILENNKEIKGYWTSEKDSAVSKGVASYEKNTLPKKVEEELKKRSNEGKTPEQLAYEEMKHNYETLLKQNKMKDLESKYKDTLVEKGLDPKLTKYILSENEEDIVKNIDFFIEIISSSVDKKVREKLANNSYTPPKGAGKTAEQIAEEQFKKALGIR